MLRPLLLPHAQWENRSMRKNWLWLLLTVLGLGMMLLPLWLWPALERWTTTAQEAATDIDSMLSAADGFALGLMLIMFVFVFGGTIVALCGVWGYRRSQESRLPEDSEP